MPSDFYGVISVPIDAGGAWRLRLAHELSAAGISVDLGKVAF